MIAGQRELLRLGAPRTVLGVGLRERWRGWIPLSHEFAESLLHRSVVVEEVLGAQGDVAPVSQGEVDTVGQSPGR